MIIVICQKMEITYKLFDNTEGKFTQLKDIYTLDDNCKYLKIKFNIVSHRGLNKHDRKMIYRHLDPTKKVNQRGRISILTVPRKIFNNLSKLEVLDLSDNKMPRLYKLLFVNLVNLKELYLSGNMIKKFDSLLFSFMPNLRILDCSDNNLSLLPEDIFSKQSKLEKLLLNNNDLKFISDKMFDNCKSLQILYIYENNPNLIITNLQKKIFISDFRYD